MLATNTAIPPSCSAEHHPKGIRAHLTSHLLVLLALRLYLLLQLLVVQPNCRQLRLQLADQRFPLSSSLREGLDLRSLLTVGASELLQLHVVVRSS